MCWLNHLSPEKYKIKLNPITCFPFQFIWIKWLNSELENCIDYWDCLSYMTCHKNRPLSQSSYFASEVLPCSKKDWNLIYYSYLNYGSKLLHSQLKVMGTSWGDPASLKPEAARWLPPTHYMGGLTPQHSLGRVVPPNMCTWWHRQVTWCLRHPARLPALPLRVQSPRVSSCLSGQEGCLRYPRTFQRAPEICFSALESLPKHLDA